MSLIPNPQSVFLREPNLLTPGKKPIGSVKIDYSNSLAQGCTRFLLFGTRFVKTPRANATNVIYDYASESLEGAYTDDSNELPTLSADYITGDGGEEGINTRIGDVISTNDAFTVMARFRVHTMGLGTIYSSDNNVSSLRTWQLRVNNTAGAVRMFGFRTTVNVVSIITPDSTITTNTWYTACGTFDTNEVTISIDGEEKGSTVNSTGLVNITASTDSVLARQTTSDPTGSYVEEMDGDVSWCGGWNRVLSQDEIREMHRDPYQFLIPA